ncbi:MAG: sensor domain-containing diguanylate cyclase [Candidatus Omnitrophota bacterium]|nr:sensor domain-containing diguanylate cyclase [Candidatus Omnitrophota bacterium]
MSEQEKQEKDSLAVMALQVSSMQKEIDKRSFYLSVLYSIGEDIASVLDLEVLLKITVDMFTEIMRTKKVAIFLSLESGGLRIGQSKGFDKDILNYLEFHSSSGLLKFLSVINQPLSRGDISKRGYKLSESEEKVLGLLGTIILSPIVFKGQMIGLLSLGQRDDNESYEDDDLEFLNTLSSQIGVVVSNASLYQKLEVSNRELDKKVFDLMTIHQMSRAISSILDLDKLKELIMDVFLDISHVEKGVLFLLDNEIEKITPVVKQGFRDDELKNVSFLSDNILAEKFIREKEILIFSEGVKPEYWQEYKFSPAMANELVNSGLVLYIPLIVIDTLVGIIALGGKANNEEFHLSEIQLLSTLSVQVAVAVENARLYELAIRDGLTKVFIHRYFQQQLSYEIKRSHRYRREVSMAIIDIDDFKTSNDNYGHQQGDLILKEMALLLKANLRDTDILSRYGGDEFTVIMPETDILRAKWAAERLRGVVEDHHFAVGKEDLKITISLGLATYPDFASSKEELIRKADQALYKSKRDGKNRTTICTDF